MMRKDFAAVGVGMMLLGVLVRETRAVPVIDGTADAEYGAAVSVQNTNTGYGDAWSGDAINAGNGSELDQVFATISAGRLHVVVAGNLESNFNKLQIFIDSEPGGVNSIDGGALPGGVDAFCCGGFPPPDGGNTFNDGALQRMNSLTFDAGFNADHYLTFTHGFEDALDPNLRFWAMSAHYADLTAGMAGRTGALGIQLAPHGLPNVLRGDGADADVDGDVDGADFLTWQRNVGLFSGANRTQGDANFDGAVDGNDLGGWEQEFGFRAASAALDDDYFAPQAAGIDNSLTLLGPALPELSQGDLIDRPYAMGLGGATDYLGTGAIARELEFVLPPIPGTTNAASHRDMENIVDLQMAINNSNTAGVDGDGGVNGWFDTPTTGNPQDVVTGVEFSIPLSEIGYSSGNIKLTAFISGTFHDSISNQVSGEGILFFNLGGLMPDFELEFAGEQYVTVVAPLGVAVPEPCGTALVALGALAGAINGRRWRGVARRPGEA